MPGTPIVSVAIATYNSARYVEAAVRSALHQSLEEIEVIIVDDCSTDDTMAILERLAAHDKRILIDRLPSNQGPASARNRAIAMARGQWFAVLDSDDMFKPDRLEHLIAVANREGADVIVDELILFDDEEPMSAALFLGRETRAGWRSLVDYLRSTVMYGKSANLGYLKPVVRLETLRAAGISYNKRLRIAEDDDFIVRMLLSGMRYWLEPTPGYAYRRHAASISHRLSVSDATVMKHSSEQLMTEVSTRLSADVRGAFGDRHAAIERAQAFSCFIDALKARNPFQAAVIAIQSPGLIGLLHMPAGAALGRLRPNWLPRAPKPVDAAAAASLARLLTVTQPSE